MSSSARMTLRLAILGLVTVIVQIAAVSQISIVGVSADLTPLVVMSVGLLTGSIPGALMGFGMGLLVDSALVETLGVSSLVYILIGYGAGRLRELRDPAHALTPVAIGAAATAIAALGFSVIQFLLGVDAQEVNLYQRVHVTPYTDLRKLDFVQILTRPAGGG